MTNVIYWLNKQGVVTFTLVSALLSLASWFGYRTGLDQVDHRVLRAHVEGVTALLTTVTIFAIDGRPTVAQQRAIAQPTISRLMAEQANIESRPVRNEAEKFAALQYGRLALKLVNDIIEFEGAEEVMAVATAQATKIRTARLLMSAEERLLRPELGSEALILAIGEVKASRAKVINAVVDIWPMLNGLKSFGFHNSEIIDETVLAKYAWQINLNPSSIGLTDEQFAAMSAKWGSHRRPR